jgi:predicted Zn-dependent protease
MADIIENLEKMLEQGSDTALLRFGLGNEYLKRDRPEQAAEHLRKAVELDSSYSAAWKLLGKALTAAGDSAGALAAYASGIAAAEEKGDKQAVKEMQVFRKRLQKPG